MPKNTFVVMLIAGLLLVSAIVFGVIFLRLFYFTDEKAISDWARANDYTVLEIEKRKFSDSPFPALSFDSDQQVYRVRVRDKNGDEKNGWVRCHGLEKKLVMERVEAVWDEK